MKIAVYAISKDEEKFVKDFYESAKGADFISITDTGSTDRTVEIARELGISVNTAYVKPWRFDDARNASLAVIPNNIDVCIALDLDEKLTPGWRKEVEKQWKKDTNRMKYLYDWGANTSFLADKIHSRFGYRWKYPCHEVLVKDPRITEVWAKTEKLLITHHPDPTKSRGQYLDLLKAGSEEDPYDARSSFYYGRELFFKGEWDKSIKELRRYVGLESAKWNAEKAFAMRLIAKCYIEQKYYEEALTWCEKGVKMAPERRESWVYLAQAHYHLKDWPNCYEAAIKAISTNGHKLDWPHEPIGWGYLPYDLAAISAYWLNKKEEAVKFGKMACEHEPGDDRLKANMDWYSK